MLTRHDSFGLDEEEERRRVWSDFGRLMAPSGDDRSIFDPESDNQRQAP